jgi:hypothetical protein
MEGKGRSQMHDMDESRHIVMVRYMESSGRRRAQAAAVISGLRR